MFCMVKMPLKGEVGGCSFKNSHGNYIVEHGKSGAQWLSGRVLDSRPRAAGSNLTGITALSLSKTQ